MIEKNRQTKKSNKDKSFNPSIISSVKKQIKNMGGLALSDKQHLSNKPRNPDPMLQYGSIILCTKVQYQKYMEIKNDMKPPNPILHIQSQTKVKIYVIYILLFAVFDNIWLKLCRRCRNKREVF